MVEVLDYSDLPFFLFVDSNTMRYHQLRSIYSKNMVSEYNVM